MVLNSKIGAYTSIGRNTNVINAEIGKFCSISWNVTIGATQHYVNKCSTHSFAYISQFDFVDKDERIETLTKVGNDVWIGVNAVILPGVEIGNGVIIGAGSVVTKNIEDYSIVVGAPGRIIKKRFNERFIEILNKIKWWDWEKSIIKNNLNLFQVDLTQDVLEELEKIYNNLNKE